MSCISCGAGFHEECESKPCCCSSAVNELILEVLDEDDHWRKKRRKGKRNATLKDQQSTGRKRAAKLFPLEISSPCEWRNLRNAGGGKYPIVGCRTGLQQARHHGPDKNTLNNNEGNVHRICHTCHNRWHARNNAEYVAGEIPNKHDQGTLATMEEWLEAEMYFANHVPRKAGKD